MALQRGSADSQCAASWPSENRKMQQWAGELLVPPSSLRLVPVRSLGCTSGISRVWLEDVPQAWPEIRSGIRVTRRLLALPSAGCLPGGWSDHHHQTQGQAWTVDVALEGGVCAATKQKHSTRIANHMAAPQSSQCVWVRLCHLAFHCPPLWLLLLGPCKRSRATKDYGSCCFNSSHFLLLGFTAARKKDKKTEFKTCFFLSIVYGSALQHFQILSSLFWGLLWLIFFKLLSVFVSLKNTFVLHKMFIFTWLNH